MAEALPARTPFPELSIVLFNVHSSDTSVRAADRQNCMREVLDSVLSENYPDPLVVLCQDNINGPKHKIVCEKLGQQPKSIRCQTEAGVYYRSDPTRRFTVRYVDVGVLRHIDDLIGLEPNNPFEVARLMASVLTWSGPAAGSILFISWHGPETKAKKDVRLKTFCFRRLIRFSERLRKEERCDIVLIGGDFNLPADTAHQLMDSFRETSLVDGAVQDNYTAPADRRGLAVKDYVVYWPQNQLQNTHTSVICPDYRRQRGSRPFDHPIIAYRFRDAELEAAAREVKNITQPEE